jgi:hypothetical protein
MKNIDISQIVEPTALQPFTANSLKFLQDYNTEDKAAIIKGLVISNLGSYSLTVPYVISGCVVSDSDKDVTAGEIFYGGKFYETTAVNGTTNVARFILTKTQDPTADPLIFTDSSSKSVHDIYKYVATDVASGGDFISTDLVSLYGVSKITFNHNSANQSTSSTSYVDLTGSTYTTPATGTKTWLILFNGVHKTNTSNGDGTRVQIYNATTATEIATSRAYLDVLSTTVDLVELNVSVQKIISLPASTNIKIRFLSISGGGISLEDNDFSIVEI